MPKVQCFEIAGLICWFWSNDHDPPHFHVKRTGEWEIRVKFTEGEPRMFELVWGGFPGVKVRRKIARNVEEHRVRLLAEWEANVNE